MAKTVKPGGTRRGKGRPAREQGGVGRGAMIEAASTFLKRQLSSETTRAEFARGAGIDPSLVRYYFGDIASLLTEGMHHIFDELQSRRGKVAPDQPLREQLRKRIGSLVEVLMENPQLHYLVMKPMMHRDAARIEEVEALRRDYTMQSFAQLEAILQEARDRGESTPTDTSLLFIVLLGLSDFAVRYYEYFEILGIPAESRAAVLARYVDFAADLIMDGLRPREA